MRGCITTRRGFARAILGGALAATFLFPPAAFALDSKAARGNAPVRDDRSSMAEAILFYGQSNAGGGGHARPYLTAPVFPDRIFTFRTARQIYATSATDPRGLEGLGAVSDHAKYAPFPATAMAYALAHANGSEPYPYFIHTVWYGGQPLTSFLPGTNSWRNLTRVAGRMGEALAQRNLRGRVAALVLIQGESGPPGRERYATLLRELLDRALGDLKSQTGQARPPIAILLQTNESNVQAISAKGVALAQWDVAQSRPDDTVLAGPMYQMPLSDAVHQSAEGRMMLGDLLAQVFEARVERGGSFEPLHPTQARNAGGSVVVSFKRPEGSQPLAWDTGWVPPAPHFGFDLADDAGPVEIADVKISGESEVTITPARALTGRATVRYAMTPSRAEGWAPGRGQLTAPTAERSAFADLGLNVPKTVAHYAIRFEMPVM